MWTLILFCDFQTPGFVVGMKKASRDQFKYPDGTEWQRMFKEGIFTQD